MKLMYLELEVDGKVCESSIFEVLEYKLKYKDIKSKDKVKVTGKVVMETTRDEEKVKEKDPEVLKFEKVQKIEDSVHHYYSIIS